MRVVQRDTATHMRTMSSTPTLDPTLSSEPLDEVTGLTQLTVPTQRVATPRLTPPTRDPTIGSEPFDDVTNRTHLTVPTQRGDTETYNPI